MVLQGELSLSSDMEQLQTALFYDSVPESWSRLAYPSTKTLALWYSNLQLHITERIYNTQLFHFKVYIIISCRFSDVLAQCRELDTWTQDFVFPAVVWISGLFSPQSFLTGKTNAHMNTSKTRLAAVVLKAFCFAAILQSIARKNKWPLDRMSLSVDVTKKTKDDYGHPPREGAYIHGLFIEGEHKLHSNVNFLFVWMNVTALLLQVLAGIVPQVCYQRLF